MRINPLVKKFMITNARSVRIPCEIFALNLVFATIMMIVFKTAFYESNLNSEYTDVISNELVVLFGVLFIFAIAMICFTVPSFVAGSISGERERQTLDILLTTSLSPTRIVLGNLMCSMLKLTTLLGATFPVWACAFVIGGISIRSLAGFFVCCLVASFMFSSIGLLMSAQFKKTNRAITGTYLSVMAFTIGTVMILFGVFTYYSIRNTNYSMTVSVNLAEWEDILLVNPIYTYLNSFGYKLIGSDLGYSSVNSIFSRHTGMIKDHWFLSSCITQIAVGTGTLLLAIRKLNPIKK